MNDPPDSARRRSPRVLLTGGSGLVGRALAAELRAEGWEVLELSHRARPDALTWTPEKGEMPDEALVDVNAVVHLAGEPVAQRWTDTARKRIRDSRVVSTRLLAECMAARPAAKRPQVFLCASAIGFYGNDRAEVVDESSSAGSGFLAEVVSEWEAAAAPAGEAGIRVVFARLGVVLAKSGGALAKMLPPFRLGLGGPLGSGAQRMSWIALPDVVGILSWLLIQPSAAGAYNVVAPAPCTNRELTATLARVLQRPAALPVPAFALKLMLGEMAEVVLGDLAVQPTRLAAANFTWRFPTLEAALRQELAEAPKGTA